MLSPMKASTSKQPVDRLAACDRDEARVLVGGRRIWPAEHDVEHQTVRDKHGLSVGAFRLQTVGDDGDASAKSYARAPESLWRRARNYRLLANDPGVPAVCQCKRQTRLGTFATGGSGC